MRPCEKHPKHGGTIPLVLLVFLSFIAFGAFFTQNVLAENQSASFLVKMVAGLTVEQQAAVVARNGGTEISSIPSLRLHVVEIPSGELDATISNYQFDSDVERVEIDQTRKTEGTPSDPSYPSQWSLPKIAWDQLFDPFLTLPGAATVAVLDTGIDAAHPDINDNVIPGISIVDGSNGMTDPNGHGTWMAGIVAAVPNDIGIAGVGFTGVQMMPVTVLGADGTGQDSDIIAGVMYAADNGADVILMGFSNSGYSQSLQDAIDYAWARNAVLVAATGNEGSSAPTYPAGDQGVVGVSATDDQDNLALFSNYGADAFLAAPGTNILTTGLNNSYTNVNGTSASAAIVAGVTAFMRANDPSLTNGVIIGRIARMADPAGTLDQTGNGRVNMARAVYDTGTDPVVPLGAPSGGPIVGPYVIGAAIDGGGGIVVSPDNVSVGSSGNIFTFTFTALSGANFQNGSQLSMIIPAGWTAPSGKITVAPAPGSDGCTSAALNSITGAGPWTVLVDMNCPPPKQFIITYSPVTAPAVATQATFTTATKSGSTGTLTNITVGSPVVFVNNPAPSTTGIAPASATYGGPGFTLTVQGANFVPDSTVQFNGSDRPTTFVSSSQLTAVIPAGDLSAAGTFGVTVFNPSPGGGASNSQAFTVAKRTATIRANNKNRIYGDANPVLDATVTGTVGGDTLSFVLNTAAVTNSGIGSYPIVVTPGSNPNYAVTTTDGTLVVAARPATIAANNKSKTYGAANPALDATVSGAAAGDTLAYGLSTTAAAGSSVGGYPITVTPGSNPNYAVTAINGVLTIAKKPASVTPNAAGKTYGDADPALSGTLAGFLAGDGVTASYSRTAGESVAGSPYTISATLAPAGVLGNYDIAYNTADFTITKAVLSVTANNASRTYGSANPPFTAGYSGFRSGDTAAVLNGSPLLTTTATPASPVGTYTITAAAGTLTATNYTFTFTNGALTIGKAALTIRANDATKTVGQTVTFAGTEFTAGGLLNGNTVANVTLTSSGAGASASVGTYAIVPSAATGTGLSNYVITYVNGALSVNNKVTPAVTAWPTASPITYGQQLSASALTGGSASVPGSFAFTAPATVPNAGAALQSVTFTPNDTSNYNIVTGSISVSVAKATPSVTAWPTAGSITYGQPLASSTLVGGSASVPGSFVFTTPAAIPEVGTAAQAVTFMPGDATNFNAVSGSVSVTVAKADQAPLSVNAPSTLAYGNTAALSTSGGSGTGALTFSTGASTGCSLSGTVLSVIDASGFCSVTATKQGDGHYNGPVTSAAVAVTLLKANQATLTIVAPATLTYGNTAILSTTGGNGTGALTYSAGSSTGCFLTGNTLSVSDASGSCSLTATKEGDRNYNGPVASTATVALVKADQAALAINAPATLTYGATAALSANGGSGTGSVSYSVGTSTGCTVADGMLSVTNATGSCSVSATKAADNNYNEIAATAVPVTLKKAMTVVLEWPAASQITYGQHLSDSSLSGGSASVPGGFAFTAPATAPNAGTYNAAVIFTPTDAANYETVEGFVSVVVVKADQATLTVNAPASLTYGDTATVSIAGGNGNGAVTFSAGPSTGCMVAGSTVSVTNASGTCFITATKAADVNYNAAASSPAAITLQKAGQTITFLALPEKAVGDADYSPGASASSGLVVTYESSNAAVATIVNNRIHIIGVGTTTVAASQGGNTNYNAAPGVSRSLTVKIGGQTITVSQHAPANAGYHTTFTVAASASSGLPVAIAASGSCSGSGSGSAAITMTDASGTCTVAYNQAGSVNYAAAAEVTESTAARKADQTITFSAPAGKTFGDAPFTVSAGATSGLPVGFISRTNEVCTMAGNTVTIVGAGTCTISLSQSGSAYYEAVSSDKSITIYKSGQAITFSALPGVIIGDPDFVPGATASSGLGVTYGSSNTAVAMIVDGMIHIVGPGTSTITAYQAGNANYLAASPVPQTLTVGDIPTSTGGGTWGSGSAPPLTWKGDIRRDNTINFFANTSLCQAGAACIYQWNFGEPDSGSKNTTTGATVFHTYAQSGSYNVTLTVISGDASRAYTVPIYVNTRPTASHGTVIVNRYTVTFTDLSTDDPELPADAVTINWGDGTSSQGPAGTVFTHTYDRAKTYTIIHSVKDAGVDVLNAHGDTISGQYRQYSNESITVSVPQKFTISGVVSQGAPASGLNDVLIILKKGGHTVAKTKTDANGSYSFTVRPGVYSVSMYKKGYSFEDPGLLDASAGDVMRDLAAAP